MDPISALSAAAGVIAFIDFGGKLLSRYLRLKRVGDKLPPNPPRNIEYYAAEG